MSHIPRLSARANVKVKIMPKHIFNREMGALVLFPLDIFPNHRSTHRLFDSPRYFSNSLTFGKYVVVAVAAGVGIYK